MKKQILFLIGILACAGFGFSQEKNLRESFVLNLAVSEDQYYAAELGESPYVLPENTVQVYPGEELYIEADVENDVLVNLKNVGEIKNPEKTLIIKFSQICDGRKHQAMMLSVFNPFEKDSDWRRRSRYSTRAWMVLSATGPGPVWKTFIF